jgi:hypothetical protein
MPEKGMDRRGIGGHAIVAHDSRQQAAGLADHRRGSRQAGVTFGVRNHTVHGGAADLEPLGDLRGTEPFVLQPQDSSSFACFTVVSEATTPSLRSILSAPMTSAIA